MQWEARITSIGSSLLDIEQLQLVMTRGLILDTAYTDLRSLLSILRGVTDGGKEEMEEMRKSLQRRSANELTTLKANEESER